MTRTVHTGNDVRVKRSSRGTLAGDEGGGGRGEKGTLHDAQTPFTNMPKMPALSTRTRENKRNKIKPHTHTHTHALHQKYHCLHTECVKARCVCVYRRLPVAFFFSRIAFFICIFVCVCVTVAGSFSKARLAMVGFGQYRPRCKCKRNKEMPLQRTAPISRCNLS